LFDHVERIKGAGARKNYLFGDSQEKEFVNRVEWSEGDKAKYEREALGFYLQGHPIKHYTVAMKAHEIPEDKGFVKKGIKIKAIGIIEAIKPWDSKNGKMAFIDLQGYKPWSVILWAGSWSTYKNHLKVGDVVVAYGRKVEGDNKFAIDVEKGDKFDFVK